LAGAAIPAGAALARVERLLPGWAREELRHTVMAFGAGALLAAVALVLVPEGSRRLTTGAALGWFAAGGMFFLAADLLLARLGGRASQFMAMLLDYIPEALALGALIAGEPGTAVLVAVLIAIQNLPEGFNAWRELQVDAPVPRKWLPWLFVLVVPLGPIAAAVGLFVIADTGWVLGAVMLFAAGGILYLIFQDIAPQVPLERHWSPPLGAVAGFGLGLAGHMLISGAS
jgi:ZIP family zinc transporter